jgi:hypothetical protein
LEIGQRFKIFDHHFYRFIQKALQNYFSIDGLNRTSALLSWSQIVNQRILRAICFFRQIDEFEGLHADDRFILIKYNLFPIFSISRCYHYKPINGCSSNEENDEAIKYNLFYMLRFESNGILEICGTLLTALVELTEQDPTVLALILTIPVFSQGFSMNDEEPALKDSLAVSRAQLHYTKLLWNYMVNKQGEMKTCQQFIQLLTIIFRIQSAVKRFREILRFQFTSSNTVDRLEPLMQTILNIS